MQLPWRSLHRPPTRAPHPAWPPTATSLLLALLAAGVVVQWTLRRADGGPTDPLLGEGALTAGGLKAGRVWQVLTHLFLNTGSDWLLPVSLLTLALAGRPLEGIVGRRHLWQLFGLAGVAGGLGQVGFDALLGHDVPVAGASSGVMGLLLALAYAAPKTPLLPWQGGGPLRRVRAVHGTLGALATAVVAGTHPPAAGALVGGLTGCLYMHALGFGRWTGETDAPLFSASSSASWEQSTNRPKTLNAGAAVAKGTPAAPDPVEVEQQMTAREFIAAKVDPVLEKICREGMSSLTAEERKLLERASEKVSRGR